MIFFLYLCSTLRSSAAWNLVQVQSEFQCCVKQIYYQVIRSSVLPTGEALIIHDTMTVEATITSCLRTIVV